MHWCAYYSIYYNIVLCNNAVKTLYMIYTTHKSTPKNNNII